MDELLRYLWLHGTERAASELLVYVILLIMALGSVKRSRILSVKDTDGLVAAAVVAVIANVLANEKIAAFLQKNGGEIRKTIVVKNKLVNLIVK